MWGSAREEDGCSGDGDVVVVDDDDEGGDIGGETLDDSLLSFLFLAARGALLVLGKGARSASVMGGRSRPTEVYPVATTEDPTPPLPSPPPTITPPPPPLPPSLPPRCMLQEALDAALLALLLLLLLPLLLPPPAVVAAAGPGILTCGRGSGR